MTERSFKLILPLSVGGRPKKGGGKTKVFWLNLNQYRNAYYQTLNKAKKDFKESILEQIKELPNLTNMWGQVTIHYTYYHPTRRKSDVANIVSVVDKFFCDALVETGKLEDDNYDFLRSSSWGYGGHDKDRPRMEAVISRYKGD